MDEAKGQESSPPRLVSVDALRGLDMFWNFRFWAQPFVWIGTNALTIYLLGNLVHFQRLAERFVGGDIRRALGPAADFVSALVGLLLAMWVVAFLYRRRIFLRL
jgi:hypothetical protein